MVTEEKSNSEAVASIIVEKSEGVQTIIMNRPQTLNAWNSQMSLEATEALKDARQDRDVRVVVITGAGKGFSSGLDMGLLSDFLPKIIAERSGCRCKEVKYDEEVWN